MSAKKLAENDDDEGDVFWIQGYKGDILGNCRRSEVRGRRGRQGPGILYLSLFFFRGVGETHELGRNAQMRCRHTFMRYTVPDCNP